MAQETNGLELLKSSFKTAYVLEKPSGSKAVIFTNTSEVKSDIETLAKFSKTVKNYCKHNLSDGKYNGTKYISIDECQVAFIGSSTIGCIFKLSNIVTDNSFKALVNCAKNVLLLFPNEVDDSSALNKYGFSPTGLVVIKCLLVATSICFGVDLHNLRAVERCIDVVPEYVNLDVTKIYETIPNPNMRYYIIVFAKEKNISVIESVYEFKSEEKRKKALDVMFPDNYLQKNGYTPYLARGSDIIIYEPGQEKRGPVGAIPTNAKKYKF